jgi:hypothetical protein
METSPKPDPWRQPGGTSTGTPAQPEAGPGKRSGREGRRGAKRRRRGKQGARRRRGRWAGASAGVARLYRQSAAASAARRHTKYGAWRRARISSYGCDKEGWPCGAGAPAAGVGVAREAGVAAVSYPATAPATVARGLAGDAATSPFDLVSIPAAWTPSTRPFDRDTGPSGDTARVTQSAAVCRHFPVRASAPSK